MDIFLDALSDASSQMTETLTSVGQAFEAGWGTGLEALLERPAALFYLAALVTFIVFMICGPRGGRSGYQRGRFLTTNEKSFLMTLDAALGQNYAHPVIMRSSRVQPLHVPRWISGITPSHKALLYA